MPSEPLHVIAHERYGAKSDASDRPDRDRSASCARCSVRPRGGRSSRNRFGVLRAAEVPAAALLINAYGSRSSGLMHGESHGSTAWGASEYDRPRKALMPPSTSVMLMVRSGQFGTISARALRGAPALD